MTSVADVPTIADELDESHGGQTDSTESQTKTTELWLLIIGGAVLLVMCLLTSGVFLRLIYRAKTQETHSTETNIANTIDNGVEMAEKETNEIDETENSTGAMRLRVDSFGQIQMEQPETEAVIATLGAPIKSDVQESEPEPELVVSAERSGEPKAPATDAVDEKEVRTEEAVVRDWLRNEVGLEAYFSNFWDNGYESLQYIRFMAGEEDLMEIGITDEGHQTRLMRHIRKLNENDDERDSVAANQVEQTPYI